jgi:DNA-binding MarR family transcriptional regulator
MATTHASCATSSATAASLTSARATRRIHSISAMSWSNRSVVSLAASIVCSQAKNAAGSETVRHNRPCSVIRCASHGRREPSWMNRLRIAIDPTAAYYPRVAKTGLAIAFSRAEAAFSAALRAALKRERLRGIVDPGMGPVLFALDDHGVLSMSQLAEAAGVPRSTMTGIAARLTERDLVRAAPNPRDGRGIVVALTAKGRAVVPRVRRIERALDVAMQAAIGDDDVELVTAALNRLADKISTR